MFTPESETVPVVVFATPTVPAKMTLTVPLRRSKSLLLVSVPVLLVMEPLVRASAATVSEYVPRLKMPPETVTVPVSGSTLLAPRARVPALAVVPPV